MLGNPKALPNLAMRLQAMPQHVQVQENPSEVSEVDQGLVIHHVLTYQILPGKCADAGARRSLLKLEFLALRADDEPARCGVQRAGQAALHCRPRKRQAAIAAFQQKSAAADVECEPAHRRAAQITGRSNAARGHRRQGGAGRSARMSSLSDDDLKMS